MMNVVLLLKDGWAGIDQMFRPGLFERVSLLQIRPDREDFASEFRSWPVRLSKQIL